MRLLIRDLQPETDYGIQVRADTGTSVSEWSRIFEFTTISDSAAPRTPTNVTWEPSGDAFVATWDEVTHKMNGKLLKNLKDYNVRITDDIQVEFDRTTHTKYKFTRPMNKAAFGKPKHRLGFQVRAIATNGLKSEWSDIIYAENNKPDPPTITECVGTLEGISLAWDLPAGETDLSHSTVYISTEQATLMGALIWKGNATAYLYPTGTYALHYVAVTVTDIYGLESDPATATATPRSPFLVDVEAPEVPTGLTATLNTDDKTTFTTATVTWSLGDAPTDLGEFQIRYRAVGETAWNYHNVSTNDVPMVTQTTITHLKPYVNYEFQIEANDFYANHSGWSETFIAVASNNTAPSKPAPPGLAGDTMSLQVTHPNTKADGTPMDADIHHYEVYAHQSNTFVAAPVNMIGTIEGPAWVGSFFIPTFSVTPGAVTQPWYARVIAVDTGGLKSPMSDISTANTALLNYVNIKDAAITDAKIQSVAANKLVAGTGLINDLTVKSVMTLGDSLTDGVIQSNNYVPGVSGFRMNKSSLEMNSGSITAGAITLQSGKNLIPYEYSDFELPLTFYNLNLLRSGLTFNLGTSSPRFGSQYAQCSWGTVSANPYFYMGFDQNRYNLPVEGGKTYILSAYVRNSAGTVSTIVFPGVRWSDGTSGSVTSFTPVPGSTTWTRISGTITAPAGATGGMVYFVSTTWTSGAGFEVDGVQFEPRETALNTPSPYAPGSMTQIDGGIIKTGQIQSWNTVYTGSQGWQPSWSINFGGYAQFGGATVRGNLIVGSQSGGIDQDQGYSYIQAANFSSNTRGWHINSNGAAEFATITARGIIETSVTGNRVVMRDNGSGTGEIRFFTGAFGESYGYIRVVSNQMQIAGHSQGGWKPIVRLDNDPGGGSGDYINLLAHNVIMGRDSTGSTTIQSGNIYAINANQVNFSNADVYVETLQLGGFGGVYGASYIANLSGTITFDVFDGQLRLLGRSTFAGMLSAPNADVALVWQGDRLVVAGPAMNTSSPGTTVTRSILALSHPTPSDMRLKENAVEYKGALAALDKIPVYIYNFKDDPKMVKRYGIYAQDAEKYAPYVLGQKTYDTDYLTINSTEYTSFVAAATKELYAKVKTLESKVKTLEQGLTS